MKKIFAIFICLFLAGCQMDTLTSVLSPLPTDFSTEEIDNCTLAVSFQKKDMSFNPDGAGQISLKIHQYEKFSDAEIKRLKVGDILLILSREVKIFSLSYEKENRILINGSLDAGGYELALHPDGYWYVNGYNDTKAWYEAGAVTLPVANNFVYIDASNLDAAPSEYSFSYLMEQEFSDYMFSPHSTTATIKNGRIIMVKRVYFP